MAAFSVKLAHRRAGFAMRACLRTSSGEANDAASRVAHAVASNGTSSVAQPAEVFVSIEAVTHPRESLQRLMSHIFSTKSLQRHASVTHPIKTFQRRTPQKFSGDTSLTYWLFVCSHFGLRASPQSGLRQARVLSDLQWRSERGSEQGCTCCCKQCIKQC